MSDIIELFPTLNERAPVRRHEWPKAIDTRYDRCRNAGLIASDLQAALQDLLDESTSELHKELLYSAMNAVCDAQISISQVRRNA